METEELSPEQRLSATQEHIAILTQIAINHTESLKNQSAQIQILKSVLQKLLEAIENPGTVKDFGTENSIITP